MAGVYRDRDYCMACLRRIDLDWHRRSLAVHDSINHSTQHLMYLAHNTIFPATSSGASKDLGVRQLHSDDTRTLVVSRTRSSFGDRTFAAAGPQVD